MRHAVDALIVIDFAYSLPEIWLSPVVGHKPALTAGATLASLPLLARRRFPVQSALCVFVAPGLMSFIDPASPELSGGFVSYVVAVWVAGSLAPRRQNVAMLLIALATPALLIERDRGFPLGTITPLWLGVFGVWLLATAWQGRERRIDDLEERTRSAVAQERARIARELHDVIAHCVSVMTVQAGAARLLLDEEPQSARQSLLAVEDTGRQTLGEMRRCWASCAATWRRPASRRNRGWPISTACWRAAGRPACASNCGSRGSPPRWRPASTSPPIASCRRP